MAEMSSLQLSGVNQVEDKLLAMCWTRQSILALLEEILALPALVELTLLPSVPEPREGLHGM